MFILSRRCHRLHAFQCRQFIGDQSRAIGYEPVAVGAQWTTSSKQPADLVYELTKALWSDKTRTAMDHGHAKGKEIRKETALQGVGIPLHAGAEKFYKEIGLIK